MADQLSSERDALYQFLRETHTPVKVMPSSEGGRYLLTAEDDSGLRTFGIPAKYQTPTFEPAAANSAEYLFEIVVSASYWSIITTFVGLQFDEILVSKPNTWLPDLPASLDELVRITDGVDIHFERRPVRDLAELVEQHRKVVILGDPGIGKTTTMKRATWEYAINAIRRPGSPTPIYIPLRLQLAHESPSQFVERMWKIYCYQASSVNDDPGSYVLLLDGLNEIEGTTSGGRASEWAQFIQSLAKSRVLITSRKRDYDVPLRLHQIEIRELNVVRQTELLSQLLGETRAQEFLTHPRLRDFRSLLANPFQLSALAWIFAQQVDIGSIHPEKLLHQLTSLLLSRAFINLGSTKRDRATQLLVDTAASMQFGGKVTWTLSKMRSDSELSSSQFDDILSVAASSDLIVINRQSIQFSHHIYQETLAARKVAEWWRDNRTLLIEALPILNDSGMMTLSSIALWERLPPPPPTGWENVLPIACSQVDEPDAFLELVAKKNPVLAASTAAVSNVFSDITKRRIANIIAGLLSNLSDTRLRVHIGEILGELGDPRLRDDIHDLVGPPCISSAISSPEPNFPRIGRYTITNDQYRKFVEDNGYQRRELWSSEGQDWLQNGIVTGGVVDGMLRQRTKLIDSDTSLLDWQKHFGWSPETFEFWSVQTSSTEDHARSILSSKFRRVLPTQPAYWDRPDLRKPNAPVVGITYFEAEAFANWASAESNHHYSVQSLDSWMEWARDRVQSKFPWGDTDASGAANTIESHVLQPTAVGVFPRDVTSAGSYDVVGNVREWTSTTDESVSSAVGQKHLVGGAWSRSLAVASLRHLDSVAPDFWDYNLGVRVSFSTHQP